LISPDRSPVAKIRADAGFRLTHPVPPESFNHLLLALRDAAMAIKPAREEANSGKAAPLGARLIQT
jgi:hypothetical protein